MQIWLTALNQHFWSTPRLLAPHPNGGPRIVSGLKDKFCLFGGCGLLLASSFYIHTYSLLQIHSGFRQYQWQVLEGKRRIEKDIPSVSYPCSCCAIGSLAAIGVWLREICSPIHQTPWLTRPHRHDNPFLLIS